MVQNESYNCLEINLHGERTYVSMFCILILWGPIWGPSADILDDERTDAFNALFFNDFAEISISHLRRGPGWGPEHIFFIQTHPG